MHNVRRKALALKFREAAPDWFRTALAKELNIPVSSLAGKAGNLVRLSVITNNLDNDIGTGTVRYSEPAGFPVKFHWETSVKLDGVTETKPMVIDK